MRWLLPLALLALMAASPASACPDCETALVTRRRVSTEDFGWRAGVAVLPFVLSIAGAAFVGRALDRRAA